MFKVVASNRSRVKPLFLPCLWANGSSSHRALGYSEGLCKACGLAFQKFFLEQLLTSLCGMYRQGRGDVKEKLQKVVVS